VIINFYLAYYNPNLLIEMSASAGVTGGGGGGGGTAKEDSSGKSLREIVQKKFLEEVIGFGGNWKALVMDTVSTKIMSSACTMFDIMEKRVTIVENLANKRQPFPEMDVVYFISPSESSVGLMLADFDKKPMYGNVHIVFTDTLSNPLMARIQANGNFVARIKTFKEINIDFHVVENALYSTNMPDTLMKIYGSVPDMSVAHVIGKKLANVCICLNEHPTIRYQGSSNFAKEIASSMNSTIVAYKKANDKTFIPFGDDAKGDRERGTMLICDRSFDLTSPLMHEYTYQALVYDLLPVEHNGVIKYTSQTGKGAVEKEALLGEQDEVWVELRNSHISQVTQTIGARMKDILQNSSGAKLSGGKLSVEEMAAAVKQLPEYQQTMSRWGAHTAISSAALSKFIKDNIFPLSKVEQLATTGLYDDDEEGLQTLKSGDIFQKVLEAVQGLTDKSAKVRLVAIWWIAQKSATEEQKRQLIQAAGITGSEQTLLLNFTSLSRTSTNLTTVAKQEAKASSGVFSSFFGGGGGGGGSAKPEDAKDSSIVNSRHTPQLKIILDQLQSGDLPMATFPSAGPAAPVKDSKSAAKSVRKFGTNNRWGSKADSGFDGGRVIVFIAGGLSYSEIRVAHEAGAASRKEVIIGSTNIITPAFFVEQVATMNAAAAPAAPPRP